MLLTWLTFVGASLWLIILLLPWQPGSTREFLDGEPDDCSDDLSDITVLIPARNEAEVIQTTLAGVMAQGRDVKVILVDDQSEDQTAALAGEMFETDLKIISGQPLPDGWSGKLWALHQGFQQVDTPLALLLDADIELKPGILSKLRREMMKKKIHLISLMAYLRMVSPWEKLLMPAFIYFFKLLYPFRLSNSDFPWVAAAAGGCILLRTDMLKAIGGFAAIRGQLIDDCALARKIKSMGGRTWIGLTHSAISLRAYDRPGVIWHMVARTAFHQLRYSITLLLLLTGVMILMFGLPVAGLLFPSVTAVMLSLCAFITMILGYIPTLKFYHLSWKWACLMPLIGLLFLAMTWTSAIRFWRGKGAEWKGRAYL
ncbi:MAG: glycosyltransferase [Deltaproteobacteria bacterium]|nr:glycosyltransferase [Deltaproteobacteria bacterium]